MITLDPFHSGLSDTKASAKAVKVRLCYRPSQFHVPDRGNTEPESSSLTHTLTYDFLHDQKQQKLDTNFKFRVISRRVLKKETKKAGRKQYQWESYILFV